MFFPDEAINGAYPRYKSVTQNIRERRGEKITINVPIFPDTNTQTPFVEDLPPDCSDARLENSKIPIQQAKCLLLKWSFTP